MIRPRLFGQTVRLSGRPSARKFVKRFAGRLHDGAIDKTRSLVPCREIQSPATCRKCMDVLDTFSSAGASFPGRAPCGSPAMKPRRLSSTNAQGKTHEPRLKPVRAGRTIRSISDQATHNRSGKVVRSNYRLPRFTVEPSLRGVTPIARNNFSCAPGLPRRSSCQRRRSRPARRRGRRPWLV